MNPLRKIRDRLRRKQPRSSPSILPSSEGEQLKSSVAALQEPPVFVKKPRGRVVKGTKKVKFNANTIRTGGRVVRAMPRPLQKIKEGQERPEDADVPDVED